MRRRTLAILGAALTSALAGTAVLAAPPLTGPATASALPAFAGCEQLRQWYVDSALPMVGPWGLGSPGYYPALEDQMLMSPAAPEQSAAQSRAESGDALGNGSTGTNVQEVGVDEPDVAKTDGDIVVRTVTGGDVVVTDVRGQPRDLSRVSLPGLLDSAELLLVEDKVVVIADEGSYGGVPAPTQFDIAGPMPDDADSSTSVFVIDITDPSSPRIESRQRFGGGLVSARSYDQTVRLVITTGAPTLDFVQPNRDRTPAQAGSQNREIVRASAIGDWLPGVRSGSGSAETPLLDCDDVRHPEKPSGLGTISVITFDADTPAQRSATAVTAGGELVYSSSDRLYVATTADDSWGEPVPLMESGEPILPEPSRTQLHAFALDGAETTYVASGSVPGRVRDRWSFSEYDGHLRVATALDPPLGRDPWTSTENAVVVLEERDTDLVEVGRVAKLGIDEEIQSVRWFGDLAVVVTFRQVDPLYTIDLSDPTSPRVLGELKIPGFSAYLHPVGGDHLLGLGQDATLQGSTTGAQAAVFDIGDLADPKRVSTAAFGPETALIATSDPRAFTYLPEQRTALTPVQSYRSGHTRLAILKLASDGTINRTTTGRIAGWDPSGLRTLPLGNGKVAVVAGGEVTKLSV